MGKRHEFDPKSLNFLRLMQYVCQMKGLRELEMFASNLCEEDEKDLFHVKPDTLDSLDKLRVYMFSMDAKAIHSLSALVTAKVDNLKELTVWCEDEIPEDRTDLLVVFMSAIAQCQHKLKKLCLGLPLKIRRCWHMLRTSSPPVPNWT